MITSSPSASPLPNGIFVSSPNDNNGPTREMFSFIGQYGKPFTAKHAPILHDTLRDELDQQGVEVKETDILGQILLAESFDEADIKLRAVALGEIGLMVSVDTSSVRKKRLLALAQIDLPEHSTDVSGGFWLEYRWLNDGVEVTGEIDDSSQITHLIQQRVWGRLALDEMTPYPTKSSLSIDQEPVGPQQIDALNTFMTELNLT